jgi:hypothetical protein
LIRGNWRINQLIPVDNAAGLGATVKKGSQHAATFGACNKVKKLVAPREGPDNAAGLGATVKKRLQHAATFGGMQQGGKKLVAPR